MQGRDLGCASCPPGTSQLTPSGRSGGPMTTHIAAGRPALPVFIDAGRQTDRQPFLPWGWGAPGAPARAAPVRAGTVAAAALEGERGRDRVPTRSSSRPPYSTGGGRAGAAVAWTLDWHADPPPQSLCGGLWAMKVKGPQCPIPHSIHSMVHHLFDLLSPLETLL